MRGRVTLAVVARTPLSDYGIKRVAANHYFLGTSGAPLAVLMNRKKFEELPKPAWRKNVTGIVKGPLPFFWGVSKTV
jgi:hypothetical protein